MTPLADDFGRPVFQVGAVRLITLESIDVKLGNVQVRQPVDDPVRDQPPDAATLEDAQ